MSNERNGNVTKPVAARVEFEMADRIEEVARITRRKPAAIVKICIEDHLPVLEKALGIKPGGKGPDKPTAI